MSSSSTDISRRSGFSNNTTRKLSTLQPPPYPLPSPSDMETDIRIPMSPPPRNGTMPASLRPLVLPTPPVTPTFLPFPFHEQADLYHIRQMDSVPMFRFTDLNNVNGGAIAQCYNVFESSGTPIYTPYCITKMLSEEPVTPELEQDVLVRMSESESQSETDSDMDMPDINIMEIVPLTPKTSRPSPKIIYGGKQPPPPITIIDATLHRHDHPGSGSCDMDTEPLPSSGTIPPDWRILPALCQPSSRKHVNGPHVSDLFRRSRCHLMRSWHNRPWDPSSEDVQIGTPPRFLVGYREVSDETSTTAPNAIARDSSSYLNSMTGYDTNETGYPTTTSTERSSVSTTDTNVSPKTNIPAGSGFATSRMRRQSVYRGWWSISSAGRDDQVTSQATRRRGSRFREDMDICAPQAYFERSGSGYEGDDEKEM